MEDLTANLNSDNPEFVFTASVESRQNTRRCRIVLYSHDTMGLGHMRRNLLIAQTLAKSTLKPTILMIAGARELGAYSLPTNVDCMVLPSYYKQIDGNYIPRHLDIENTELLHMRSNTMCSAIKSFSPDVFIVDNVARGALGELDKTLQFLRRQGHTRCILGLRDIQDQQSVSRTRYQLEEQAYLDYYDAIWIYGDPSVFDLVEECQYQPVIAAKVQYTGYLDQKLRFDALSEYQDNDELHALALPPGEFVLCMVGGGQDGEKLALAFIQAQWPKNTNGILICGPYMPTVTRNRLHQHCAGKPNLRVLDFVEEPAIFLNKADKVITMGGYNSICDVLSYRKKALVVPRVKPRMEQIIRAQKLNKLNLLDVMHPDEVSSENIINWIKNANGVQHLAANDINLNGLGTISTLIKQIARV